VYDERLDALRFGLAASGLVLRAGLADADGQLGGEVTIEAGTTHGFDDVKALDLHHLGYDFVTDVEIGPKARTSFAEATGKRRRLLLAAMDYLDQTGQSEAIPDLPVDDVAAMTRVSRELSASAGADGSETFVLRSRIARLRTGRDAAAPMRRSKASSLDRGLVVRVRAEVDEAVTSANTTNALDSIPVD